MLDNKGYINNNSYAKYPVILLLAGAIVSANYVGDLLAWTGILYYLICIAAILMNYRKAYMMLWAAVGVHVVLVGQSLWNWYYMDIEPCPYCFAAAGLILVAATAFTRMSVAVLPLILMFAVGYAWPWLFAPKIPIIQYAPQIQETLSKPTDTQLKSITSDQARESEAGNQPVDIVNSQPTAVSPAETSTELNQNPGPAVEKEAPVRPEQNVKSPETDKADKTKPETKTEINPQKDVNNPPAEVQSKSG